MFVPGVPKKICMRSRLASDITNRCRGRLPAVGARELYTLSQLTMNRRTFILSCFATPLLLAGYQGENSRKAIAGDNPIRRYANRNPDSKSQNDKKTREDKQMYGIIGKINAKEGNRDKLIEILLHGTREMPGCKLYAIATDSTDDNGIWITEIWDSEESHKASLLLPGVQKAIADGKQMIAGFGDRHIVTPIGGLGVK
jgi:quinol monooxygenase YgiN